MCTTSQAAPVLDTVFTATNVGSAIYVANQNNVTNKGTAVTAGLTVAALWLSSAIYGYSKTSECQAAGGSDEPLPRPRYPTRPSFARPPTSPYEVPPSPYAPPPAEPPPPGPAPPLPSGAAPAPSPPPTPLTKPPVQQSSDDESP
jgi:hypothetical protein